MAPPELTPETYINRELSTLAFQRRVLALAQDERVPLLERAKFLAIVGNNMDEFFMVRVASLIQKVKMGMGGARPDGYTPGALMEAIRAEATEIIEKGRRIKDAVLGRLEEQGVFIRSVESLGHDERVAMRAYFGEVVYPVLTPLGVDHARPFPFISNLSLNLGVYLDRDEIDDDDPLFARIKIPVPDVLPRLISLNKILQKYVGATIAGDHFLWIEDVILDNIQDLFPGMRVLEAHPFRVLRNADIDYEHEKEDEEILDVAALIEQGVRERRFGSVVRLSVPTTISRRMLQFLYEGLGVRSWQDVYEIDGMLGLSALMELMAVDRPDLKYPPYVPKFPEPLPPEANIFSVVQQRDVILHHPYDSFAPVEEFFRAAATDPRVLAIKATLYRVGKNSPIVQALMDARDHDKQVTVLVELKARFDEENNLGWARALERKGVHVIYGVEELPVKTHAKIALVVRQEEDGVRRYVHLGTGNYNASTARLYTDMGLFSSHPDLTDDATRLFNRLTGYAPHTQYKRLLIAPDYLLKAILRLIDNEIAAARAGKSARLIFKMNQLEEDHVIERLYEASQAGVQIDLIVRGFCCLRPGVPGISENIRVISIVGRFLEHSRIFYFKNAPEDQQVYMGSADLMRRNLYNRVELLFPVLEPRLKTRALRVMMTALRDNVGAWELLADGSYVKIHPGPGEPVIDSQSLFMEKTFGLKELP